MNVSLRFLCALTLTASTMGIVSSCKSPAQPEKTDAATASFVKVKAILEQNCLHCHGEAKLSHMISLASTAALEKLKGAWIIPGKPELSRMYQVVAASDSTPMAMPPTGHAIHPHEVEAIRLWIKEGAPVPQGHVFALKPKGDAIRSR